MSSLGDDLSSSQEVGIQFRIDTLLESFSPSAPIDRRNVFAGRGDQLAALHTVIRQRGQHAVISGSAVSGRHPWRASIADQASPARFLHRARDLRQQR